MNMFDSAGGNRFQSISKFVLLYSNRLVCKNVYHHYNIRLLYSCKPDCPFSFPKSVSLINEFLYYVLLGVHDGIRALTDRSLLALQFIVLLIFYGEVNRSPPFNPHTAEIKLMKLLETLNNAIHHKS